MNGFKNMSDMSQDERFYRRRSSIQTNAIEAVEAIATFTGITGDELRAELVKITTEYRQELHALRREMIGNKIAG